MSELLVDGTHYIIVRRSYKCAHCGDTFRVIQPKTDEKIKECLSCNCPDLACHEEGIK